HSLQKLAVLPDETAVYFCHEYTLSNARFALTVDPDNERLKSRAAEIEALRAYGKFTIPTTSEIVLALADLGKEFLVRLAFHKQIA
ncbi:hydroxyacylglutathione hydrolase C-terminal domain-containing protein, partial [Rhizobium ruizarguesonis]